MTSTLVCCECGREIGSERNAYQKISGYEKKRHGGGANMIVARKTLDEWACEECVSKLRRGIDPKQRRLY